MKLPVSMLVPGMTLSRDLFGVNGEKLLKKGSVLTARHIMSLRRSGVLAVNIEGVGDDESENTKKELEDKVKHETMTKVQNWFQDSSQIKFEHLVESVEQIIEEILQGKTVRGNITEICAADMYTYAHSVDVCVLAVTVGARMKYSKKQLLHLGMGGLLHDLGKVKVPGDILNKPDRLNPEEFAEIKKHPLYGYEMAEKQCSGISRPSADIILKHHERYDGTGYPQGLKGEQLDDFINIAAITDVYNAITTDRVYRKAMPPHEAYEMMMASGGSLFKPDVLDVFLKCIVPYPEGSIVRLSNGMIGNVTKVNEDLIFRPVIKLLDTGEELDLAKNNTIVIQDLVRVQEMKELALQGGEYSAASSAVGGN